jgi:ABC-2 type transport system ATP-binding protein
LHPQLSTFFDITRKYFNESIILIQTNGLLLIRQPPDFWENCHKNKVAIEVTRYPIKLDFNTLLELGDHYDVKVEYFGGKTEPIKTMWKFTLDLEGRQDIEKTFRICPTANRYAFLYNGKISCNKCITVDAFNAYFEQCLEVSEQDYIDIYKVSGTDEILEYLRHPIPFCRYCDWKNLQTGIKWSVSKKEIMEWV